MGEMVLEKLTQKVSNMLDEIGDVNILIRRMTPTQETLNRINERVDAVFVALQQLEKGVQVDEQKLAQLEEQIALLKTELELVKKMTEELVYSFKGTAHDLKASIQGLEVRLNRLGELMNDYGKRSDGIRERLDRIEAVEIGRWEKNEKGLIELQKRLSGARVIEIIVMALVGLVLSLVLSHRG